MKKCLLRPAVALCAAALSIASATAQVGHVSPSEKKVVIDPVTGTELTFLTSTPVGDSKIYQTHPDWTSDGKWLIFRSNRVRGQAFAVNEETGAIVQVTDKGYLGMLCVARKSMKLYIMRDMGAPADIGRDPYIDAAAAAMAAANHPTPPAADATPPPQPAAATPPPQANGPTPTPDANGVIPPETNGAPPPARRGGFFRPKGPFEVIEIDLGGSLRTPWPAPSRATPTMSACAAQRRPACTPPATWAWMRMRTTSTSASPARSSFRSCPRAPRSQSPSGPATWEPARPAWPA